MMQDQVTDDKKGDHIFQFGVVHLCQYRGKKKDMKQNFNAQYYPSLSLNQNKYYIYDMFCINDISYDYKNSLINNNAQ